MRSRIVRQASALLALALLPGAAQALYMRERVPWRRRPPADEVAVTQTRVWGREILWVDARPKEDFSAGHIPGAVPLSAEDWDEELPAMLNQWTPERKVVVYCSAKSCDASREIARRLRDEAGLKIVFVLRGGWEAWQPAAK